MAEQAANKAISAGIDPVLAIDCGLVPGMTLISEQFDIGEAFVPQMLLAAEAFEAATAILTAELVGHTLTAKGKVGQGSVTLVEDVSVEMKDGAITVAPIGESRRARNIPNACVS